MRYYQSIFFTAYLILLSASILRGQNIAYKLYTPHDGLPQSQVQCTFQDSRGYIWVGTQGGICYFDGVTFHSILPKDGLPSSAIGQIQEDAKGNIWFGCGKWFCKYDGKKVSYDTTVTIIPKDWHFYIDKSFTIWCINSKDDLLYSSKDFKNWECESNKYENLRHKKWMRFNYDKDNDRFLLGERKNNTHIIASYIYSKEGHLNRLKEPVFSESGYSSNSSWNHVFKNDSLFELKNEALIFIKKIKISLFLNVISGSNGKIWFLEHYGKNLYALNPSGIVDTFPLNSAGTSLLFKDKDNNIWLGTEEGLIRVYENGFTNFKKEQLGSVWSMVEDREGSMWFGDFYTHKLRKHNGKTLIEKKIDYAIHPRLPKGDITDFYFGGDRDKLGNLYFPCTAGIKKYDGNKISLLSPFNASNNSPVISMHFYLDSIKNIIVSGTANGINIIQLKDGSSKYYGQEKGIYSSAYVLGVTKDLNGRYWLSASRGVSVFDIERDTVVKTFTNEKKNFPFYGCSNIFADYKGTIWAGSAQGLLRYDSLKNSFILADTNIIRSKVNAIKGYKDKYLVVAASDGVYFLDLKAFYTEGGKTIVRCFNQHNGYLGIEPNQNCMYVDSKDNVWVAASDIVTKIIPSELNMSTQPLTPYITQINDSLIAYEEYNKTINLPYGINTTRIRFEAVGFERPFKTEFRYKVDNKNWSKWRTEDFAVLDNLASGTYRFYVQTRPAGTVEEKAIQQTAIQFKIDLPFNKKPSFSLWLFGLIAALVGGGAYIINSMRKKAKEDSQAHIKYIEQQQQEKIERERHMKYLQIQTLQAQLNPHFIFNVLQAIQTRIYEGSREQASGLIVDLGNLIRRFLESSVNMDLSKMRNSEITLKQEINLLKSYIEFEQLQYNSRFEYDINVSEDIETENVQVPPMLIQPYVENAIKHGILYEKERLCKLEVNFTKTDDDVLVCTIIDNGVGREKAKEIQSKHIRMYKSRGTQILEERIRIMQELGHGIFVETFDNPDTGTIVKLKIDM
jgi:ligand-binding sensor domain-containing protein/signal transduction histidine kinase